jgi:serine phosphatase RsbU (regulator of sigma subunit)/DNA-binding LacI/PurR family transcriptional regulator
MAQSKKTSQERPSVLNNDYPTIGFLTEGLSGEYQSGVWPGITDAARKHNVNVICFTGGALSVSPMEPWEYQRNFLYDIAEKSNLDGFIIAGSLGSYVSDDVLNEFLGRFSHLPAVTLGPASESIPAIFVDNRSGMRSLITHLVQDHSYRKIAFIRGPEGNSEAEERFALFKDVLEKHAIPVDPDCLLPGDFTRDCGVKAVNQLISSGKEFEIIVAADDIMALGALQALLDHGKNVPEDVALVGFDDIEEGIYITPPLTTVNQPLYSLGNTAVENLLGLLRGNTIPQNTILEAKLVIRQSCGCFRHHMNVEEVQQTVTEQVASRKTLSEADVFNYLEPYMVHSYAGYTKEIVTCFCNDVNDRDSVSFLKKVDRIGRDLTKWDKRLSAWLTVFFELWKYTYSHLDRETFTFANSLLQRALVIRGEIGLREQGVRRIRAVRKSYFLHEIGDVLKNTLDMHKLLDTMCTHLPQLGIHSFYLSLYESTKIMPSKKSRLMLAFINNKRKNLRKDGVVFETNLILPDDIAPKDTLHTLVAEPLYFQKEQFGIMLFEEGLQEYERYEILKEYISGALHSAALIQKVQHQAEVLAQANTELENLREKEHTYLQAIKGELELGRKIQMGFLPQTLPQLDGYEISVAFMPARDVSGDFYDVFMLGDDMIALVIADVSGKDVSAALFMSLIRTLIRVFSERAQADGDDPLDAVEVVNDYITQHHRQEDGRSMFATIVFGLLQPSTGEFRYINAGHNAPLIIKGDTITRELKTTGPAVGLASESSFRQNTTEVEHGEMLFTYTDGVNEAQSPKGEFFSMERLVELLQRESSTAKKKVDLIKAALIEHNGDAAPYDDITILAVKRE